MSAEQAKGGERSGKPVVPMPSATVTIVRDAKGGIEVLMMRRNLKSGFVPGMHVFPGGGVDDTDFCFKNNGLCTCFDDVRASGALGLNTDGLAYWAAAIREAFEESGLLLARDGRGATLSLRDAGIAQRFTEHRRRLNAGQLAFPDLLQAEDLQLAADQLTYFAHWITPVGLPRRYDTRFFMAEAPEGQEPLQDERETIAAAWVSPGEALSRHRRGDFEMRTPTVRTLEDFADYDSVASLRRGLAARRDVRVQLPRIGPDGRRIMPGEPGYEELGAEKK
ncbi:MAG: NUDIX domain-containing protein [Burkholderiales bacterium]|nr:NUDIX domain-containing protein [Burkholderiales bacterium]MDP2397721.1 NUDIX domain-containing protein [Burkholderiales bacterium]